MEIRNFKELYNNYINKKSIENESLLLKSMVYYEKFIVCLNEEDYPILNRDENNKIILNIYTDINEVPEEYGRKYKLVNPKFDPILFFANVGRIDRLCINPQSDNFSLTNSQLMDLKRQKEYNKTSDPFMLHEYGDFLKPAYKISELNANDNKIMEIYDIYMKGNEDSLSDFYEELINRATFFVKVLPEENAAKDEKGHTLISKERVLQFVKEEDKRQYILFMTMKNALDYHPLDENDYFTIVNFEDITEMIDNYYNDIESIRIIGDIDLTIPVQVINEIKVQSDRIKRNENAEIMSGKDALTEESKQIKSELKRYFSQIEKVEQVWENIDVYVYNGKTGNKVYNIIIKLLENTEINIKEELKDIFNNRCFDVSYIEELETENNIELIYDKNLYLKEFENNNH